MFHCACTTINYQLPSKLKDIMYLLHNRNQSYGIQWLTLNQDLSAYVVRICLWRINHCDPRFETVNGAVGLCERHLINCCFLSGNCESKLLCKVSAGLFQSAVVLCRVVSCRVVSCRGTSGSGTNTIPQPPYHS